MKKIVTTIFTVLTAIVSLNAQYNIKSDFTNQSYSFENVQLIQGNVSKLNNESLKMQLKNTEVLPASGVSQSETAVTAAPKALYRRPVGTYNTGLSSEGGAFYPSYTGHGCADWQFINTSTNATSYSWDFNGNVFSTDANATNNFKIGYYYMPKLTATSTGGTSTYTYGSKQAYQMCLAGKYYVPATNAQYYSDSTTTGVDFFILGAGTYGKYAFGTGLTISSLSSTPSNAVYSFYEKPLGTLYVDSINAFIYSDSNNPFPDGGQLKLTILKVNSTTGAITTDTIAKSVCLKSDLIKLADKLYVLPFAFKDIDDFGFETLKGINISDEFVVKISGFSNPGFDLGFMSDVYNPNAATAAYDIEGKAYGWKGKYNLYINIHSAFTTLFAEAVNSNLTVHKQGGIALDQDGYVTSLYSTFLPIDEDGSALYEVTKPDWISLTYDTTYYSSNSVILPVLTASELPTELTGRTGEITITCRGAVAKISVTQDNLTGIFSTTDKAVNATKSNGNIIVNYPQGYNHLEVYSVSGQLQGSYTLNNTGNYTIPELSRGTFILKITGSAKPVAIKMIN